MGEAVSEVVVMEAAEAVEAAMVVEVKVAVVMGGVDVAAEV